MEHLKSWKDKVAEHSGVDDGLGGLLEKMLGKWKTLIIFLAGTFASILTLIVFCECCVFPGLCGLVPRSEDRAITHQMLTTPLEEGGPSGSDFNTDSDEKVSKDEGYYPDDEFDVKESYDMELNK